MTNEVVRKSFYACLEAAGLRRVKFHDLRHTFANLLIRQGTNVKYIQQQFGHSSISITLDVYSHLFDGDYRHQVSRLDDAPANADSTEVEKAKSATLAQPQRRDLKDLNSEPTKIIELTDVGGVTERPNVPVLKSFPSLTRKGLKNQATQYEYRANGALSLPRVSPEFPPFPHEFPYKYPYTFWERERLFLPFPYWTNCPHDLNVMNYRTNLTGLPRYPAIE